MRRITNIKLKKIKKKGNSKKLELVNDIYKPEGRGFYSRWCHWNFLLI